MCDKGYEDVDKEQEECPHVNRYVDDFLGDEHCDDCGATLSVANKDEPK